MTVIRVAFATKRAQRADNRLASPLDAVGWSIDDEEIGPQEV